ncbi:transglutaminase domain-containing protein [bacterium]|nr:transglutaminase domain-containing protein [bacterium]
MTRIFRLPALTALAVLLSCSNSHLIGDKSFRDGVLNDYMVRSERYGSVRSDLFGITDTLSDGPTREAVSFLLAYMPLSDLAVYEPDYLAGHVAAALRTRREMPWGPDIPVGLFLNFVLPPRVNNENPDDFRIIFYDELKQRVDGLNAVEAALEINRWCQEKVAYQASDSRTSSPKSTVLSARGRCGEESTFTVAALRTAGLPARQVYTPRWAHTDDNHAWVEFWADGRWHYLGACEPEPVPDRGWFTEPARRAMLVHTRAFGSYDGTETVVRKEQLFTEINTLNRYAETKELKVRVIDSTGNPVPGAEAGFMLYNYAEFYPLARLKCDSSGESTLMTGLGSLLIWADDGSRYGYVLASPADTVVEVTVWAEEAEATHDLDLSVPPALTPFPAIAAELAEKNNLIVKRGDSIRNAYIRSWMGETNPAELSGQTGIPEEKIIQVLKASMGNYRSISSFLLQAGSNASLAMRLLDNISEKDLRDTPAEVLNDHLANAPEPAPGSDTSLYDRYVLSPRIDNELLSPFRAAITGIPGGFIGMVRTNPASLAAWIDSAITITRTDNYYGTPVVPAGVLRLRTADAHSRDIFFVAVCRSAGVPSRLSPGTGRPQFHEAGSWHDVWFDGETKPSGDPGYVSFISSRKESEPEYHVHFTLARLEEGKFKTLDFGYGVKISDMPRNFALDPGTYMLTTGNRYEDGNVLASVSFITLRPGEDKTITVNLREMPESTLPGGKISLTGELLSYAGEKISMSSLSETGFVFIWIEPGREPTRHILNDLPRLKKEFDAWGGRFIFLTDPSRTPEGFTPEDISGTPSNSLFVTDIGLSFMTAALGKASSERPLPVVICCDADGNILFSSEGYRIGTGEQILKKIR